jgi:hypothetical protein
VGVAGNYGGEARGGRIEIKFCEVMKNVYSVTADLDDIECGKAASPRTLSLLPRIARTGARARSASRTAGPPTSPQ